MDKVKWDKLEKEINEKCKIDQKDVKKDINNTLATYQNLIAIYAKEMRLLINLEEKYNTKKQNRYHYYKSEYDLTLSAKELQMYTEADEQLKDLRIKIKKQKYYLEILDKYMALLKDKQYQIKNYIDWSKFISGE